MASLLERFSNDSADLHARLLAGLVQVRRGGRSIGAGTAWHAGGLILTNAHVVAERGRVSADLADLTVALADGREFPVRLLAADPALDLAALRTVSAGADEGAGLPTVELGDSRALRPGELVFALGFPFGVTGGATAGTVIGVGSDLPELRAGGRGREWLAASLHLRPGHSGGPMADAQGRLVGINTLMHGPDVGIAVPVHVAKEFLKRAFARPEPEAQPSARTVVV